MTKMILVGALVFGFTSLSQAEGDKGVCAKDRETLCAGVEPGDGRIAKCMKENHEKLSAECKGHYDSMKDHMKDLKEACHDDAEKFCGKEKPGKGRIMKCMRQHKEELSATCKEEIAEKKALRKSKKSK